MLAGDKDDRDDDICNLIKSADSDTLASCLSNKLDLRHFRPALLFLYVLVAASMASQT